MTLPLEHFIMSMTGFLTSRRSRILTEGMPNLDLHFSPFQETLGLFIFGQMLLLRLEHVGSS